jgi:hypothetical protein
MPHRSTLPLNPPADPLDDFLCTDNDTLLRQELAAARECYHLSVEDGWYYPDTDPVG